VLLIKLLQMHLEVAQEVDATHRIAPFRHHRRSATAASTAFTSALAERAAATEIALMAEANSLLIRCVNSQSSRCSSEQARADDDTSFK
jgi:hypothetical protein